MVPDCEPETSSFLPLGDDLVDVPAPAESAGTGRPQACLPRGAGRRLDVGVPAGNVFEVGDRRPMAGGSVVISIVRAIRVMAGTVPGSTVGALWPS